MGTLPHLPFLKMNAVGSFETSGTTCPITRSHIPQDRNPLLHVLLEPQNFQVFIRACRNTLSGTRFRLQGTRCVVDKVLLGHFVVRVLRFLIVWNNAVGIVSGIRAGCPRNRSSAPDRSNTHFSSPKRPGRFCSPPSVLFKRRRGLFPRR